jgi:hypothetical protein
MGGLMDYNARFYSPMLGRFIQPDSMTPDGPQGLNRYSYVSNNPVNFNDPTGHQKEKNTEQSGYQRERQNRLKLQEANIAKWKDDLKRQDYLFSLMFRGSGPNGSWTNKDRDYYEKNRADLWEDPSTWINPDSVNGWDQFALHVKRLASHYAPDAKGQFVRDFGLVFAGIPGSLSWEDAILATNGGPAVMGTFKGEEYRSYLHYSTSGLNEAYIDDLTAGEDQSHHYAGLFFLSYYLHSANHGATITPVLYNSIKDWGNPADVALGNGAAADALSFWSSDTSMRGVADLIVSYGE